MKYALLYAPSAERDARKLPGEVLDRLLPRLDALADDPRGPGTKALKGDRKGMRCLRVGDYRVTYRVDDGERTVEVVRMGHRESFYDR